MADIDDPWTADSNKALELSLVVPSGEDLSTLARFNPKFTYPIFGDDERIFGYQGLKISLRFHASDMRPNLKITHQKKFRSVGDTEPTNIEEALEEFLPSVAFAKSRDFEAAIRQLSSDWTPPGDVITEFGAADGGTFEVRKGNLADPAVKQLVYRVRVLVPLFIEGGILIGTDEDEDSLDRWQVFFLYYKKPAASSVATDAPPYQFAGYSTVYKFFPLDRKPLGELPIPKEALDLPAAGEFTLSELQSRARISQFVIIPTYQKSGNGSRLYGVIYEHYLRDPHTIEVTVEDPNEAFDDMRDVSDLAFLRGTPEFQALCINAGVKIPSEGAAPRDVVDENRAEETRRKYKIAPRQFARVLEMHLMSKLADSVRPRIDGGGVGGGGGQRNGVAKATKQESHEYDLWKLFVKQRLYRHNKELLSQLDRSDRKQKLSETLGSVELEYVRILSLFGRRNAVGAAAGAAGSEEAVSAASASASASKGKRRLETDNNGADAASTSSKKARVEDA